MQPSLLQPSDLYKTNLVVEKALLFTHLHRSAPLHCTARSLEGALVGDGMDGSVMHVQMVCIRHLWHFCDFSWLLMRLTPFPLLFQYLVC